MERKTVEKYARIGAASLLALGGLFAIVRGSIILAGAELVGAYFVWPKEKKGAGAHMSAFSSGHKRVLASSSSRMAMVAESPLPIAA